MAAGKPDLVVPSASAFRLAAVGWKTYADVKVKNAGTARAGASRLRVRLIGGGKTYTLAATGTSVAGLAPGSSRTVHVTAQLPAAVEQGMTFKLELCADSARTVAESNEGNNCRTSGNVFVTGPGTTDLVNEALVRGFLTKGTATVYKAQYVAGDPKLPVRYRTGAVEADAQAQEAIVELATTAPTLSAADRARVGLYAVPSPFRPHLAGARPVPTTTPRAAGAASPCAFVSALDGTVKDMNTYHKRVYAAVPVGTYAVVWWEKARPEDEADALAYARALANAWPKLTTQFKAPLSDAGRTCLNAGDGRFDVYVEPRIANAAQVLPVGIWKPTGGSNGGPVEDWGGCTNTPAYMDIKPGKSRWVVAHELMHAIQFAYTYKECSRRNNWWDEGSAVWAGDFVYPTDNADQNRFLRAFDDHAGPVWQAASDYDAWLFWYALAKANGASTLNSIFASLRTMTVRPAVNAAIPGGYARQYPVYLRWLWNGGPVGEAGFPLQKSYKGWDNIPNRPEVSADKPLTVGLAGEKTITVPVLRRGEGNYCKDALAAGFGFIAVGDCVDGHLGPQAGVFQRFTFPDNKLRELRFTNGMHGKTGQHVEAWLKLADGTWKVANWSAEETTLCRDKASEDVRELYVVSSNVAVSGDGFAAEGLEHEFRARDICELGPYTGTFSGTWRMVAPPDVEYTATFSGNLRLEPLDPPRLGRELEIVSGTFRITNVSGYIGPCTISSSGGTFTLPAPNQVDVGVMVVWGRATGATVAVGYPETPSGLTIPVTYSGGDDCNADTIDHSLVMFGAFMAYSPTLVPMDDNGVIAATVHDDKSFINWIYNATFTFTPEDDSAAEPSG